MSTIVNLRRADHSDQIPTGTKDLLETYLSKAGYSGVTFDATLGPKKKGSSATQGVRVLRYKPNSVLLTVQPGDNGSRRNIYLIMKGDLRSKDVFERLQASQREVENREVEEMSVKIEQAMTDPQNKADEPQPQAEITEPIPEIPEILPQTVDLGEIAQNEDDIYLLLASMKKRAPGERLSTWEISQVIREYLGLGDDPKRLSSQVIFRLLKKGYIEKIMGKTAQRAGGYFISIKGRELIDRVEGRIEETVARKEEISAKPTHPDLSELIVQKMRVAEEYLTAQKRLNEIRQRKAVLATEIQNRTEEHETLVREENDLLRKIEFSPGEQAAKELEEIRALLGK